MDIYEQDAQEPEQSCGTSPFMQTSDTNVQWFPPVREEQENGGKVAGVSPMRQVVLSAAMVIAGCVLTAALLNGYWHKELSLQDEAYRQRLEVLQSQLDSKVDLVPGQSVSGTTGNEPGEGMNPAQVYAQNVESVVAITCTSTAEGGFGQTLQTTASGSGFVLSEDGYIVTNYHVVEGAAEIKISTYDGTDHGATYVGGDEFNDIALLKADVTGLRPATIGSSANLIVGDQVVAIGNPLGDLASTLTVGYISAKDRVVTTDGSQISMLQTDAAINSGNSGGPLLNMLGQVVGITSAKYSGTSSSGATIEGIGFAIPMDDVIGMLEDLKNYGHITGAYLGVEVSNMDSTIAQTYGLPDGVLVRKVTEGTCADKAGVQVQDILTELGGYPISNLTDLSRALRNYSAGDQVVLTVYRNGGLRRLTVTLDEKPV